MNGSRFALVVANDVYDDPGLRRLVAPAQDAAALADALADPSVGGFDVRVLRNESAQEIRFAVEDFFADRMPEDLLLLHFSCHGLKNAAGELFLAVADTKPTRLASTAVAADFVNRQMADSRAQRIALFLDCCYGGAFPRGMVVRAAGEAQVRDAFAGQADVGGGRGRVVVTASSAMEYAFEGGQLATDSTPAPSVFTGAVVDGLTTGEADRDGDGWVGLTELVGYVTDRVHRVTPNQNPQMWTFGSQGELLIARSRVRRITPTPLAPELLEALESPLPAARFGVVDYLRERLAGADLSQAYAAWLALLPMANDDSRRVAEAATAAVQTGVARVTPPVLDLSTTGTAEVRLDGTPIALTAVASSTVPWLKVEQDGPVIRVRADNPGTGKASVVLSGPTGDQTIPVRMTVPGTDSEPPVPPPEPRPEPEPSPQPEPPRKQPSDAASAPTTAAQSTVAPAAVAAQVGSVPWWAVVVLVLGSAFLVLVNWPGASESRKLWSDESNTGFAVYRSWYDPAILASVVALVATIPLRWLGPIPARVAAGIVAGALASVLEAGLLILAAGISDGNETSAWAISIGTAAVLLAVLMILLRPTGLRWWPVPLLGAVLVVAGGILLLLTVLNQNSDGRSLVTVSWLFVLDPVVTVALAGLALATVEARTSVWLTLGVVTYAALGVIGALPIWIVGSLPVAFLTAALGNALIAAGVLIRGRPLPSRP
ncbi:caspase family protein [Kribbella sp. NPDC004536]|uniref:caspase, EACC1-associated type n=1 Tax=Kribbella sp. NPDC004536 TaxID=3364106 RepID=UPI0036C45BC8